MDGMKLKRTNASSARDTRFMRVALRLAQRGFGATSPNPMVGAVLVRSGGVLGRGWHHRAGEPHAEIEALHDGQRRGKSSAGATLYVTLEPCCTHGRTPPCTQAIIAAGIVRVVVSASDPNPAHSGRGFRILKRAGIEVVHGLLAAESARMNEAFNHWIVSRTPFVTVKAAMTLDGKIATASGESKWITGEEARTRAMYLRRGSDAILVGINTVLADDPALTVRRTDGAGEGGAASAAGELARQPRRVVLDSLARTPLTSRLVSDEHAHQTIVVSTRAAAKSRLLALQKRVTVMVAPLRRGHPDLRWVLQRLGELDVTSLLVEGGGEVSASFLEQGIAHRVAFFYAPKIIGGHNARKAVGGRGARRWSEVIRLTDVETITVGRDILLEARVSPRAK